MKKNYLLLALAFSATSVFAQVPSKDISSILEEQPGIEFGLELIGESAVCGCVGDFNNDGIDDFIVNGLHKIGQHDGVDGNGKPIVIIDSHSFLYVYLGEQNGIPILAYKNDNIGVGGNGSIDCTKNDDGSWLVVLQGGNNGNWVNDFTGNIYKLTSTGNDVEIESEPIFSLDNGAGRGRIHFMNINDDNLIDVFQLGWKGKDNYINQANSYLNDGADFWNLNSDNGVRPASDTYPEFGDINGDGKTDILLPIKGLGLFAYFNNGDGTFTESVVLEFPTHLNEKGEVVCDYSAEDDASQATLVDMDNDGKPEIVLTFTNKFPGSGQTTWLYKTRFFKYENDQFVELALKNKAGESTDFIGGQRADFAVADFDGDGNQDFILGVENQNSEKIWGCRTYFFNGNGNRGFDQTECTYADDNTTGIAPMSRRGNFGCYLVGDFNGDGKPDLVQAGTTYYAKFGAIRYYANVAEGGNSVTEETLSSVSVYATDHNLYVKGASGSTISISDLSGATYKSFKVVDNDMTIPLNLNSGVYLVKVATDKGNITKKVIIK